MEGIVRESTVQAHDGEKDAQIANLQKENEDLAAKAYNHVILNVELTTLRNQVCKAHFNQ